MKHYTSQEIEFIKNNLDKGNKELGKLLGRSADSIKERMLASGLKRTKLQVSNLRKKPNTGQFKKDSIPHNYKGGEFLSKDGYVVKSVGKCRQKLKHIYEWEKINGPLPKHHCLRCVDGNILNTSPSNWQLITRKENMLLNTIHRFPAELIKAIKLTKSIEKYEQFKRVE